MSVSELLPSPPSSSSDGWIADGKLAEVEATLLTEAVLRGPLLLPRLSGSPLRDGAADDVCVPAGLPCWPSEAVARALSAAEVLEHFFRIWSTR